MDSAPGPSSASTSKQSALDIAEERKRRSYKACLHCRSRKARCDLGSIDAPSSPPCTRCRRESRECVFAPSRRGGNVLTKRKRQREGSSQEANGNGPRSEDELVSVKVDEDEMVGHMGRMLPPPPQPQSQSQSQQQQQQHTSQTSYRQGMGMGPAGEPQPQSGYHNAHAHHPGMQYDGSGGWPDEILTAPSTSASSSQQHQVTMKPPPPQRAPPPVIAPAQQQLAQVPAPFQANQQRLIHPSYQQHYPNQSTSQPQPHGATQSLIGPTSPLRYSSLQNLLLPSPGGTSHSQSSYSMSGESPMGGGIRSNSVGSVPGIHPPPENTPLQSGANLGDNQSPPTAKRQRLGERSTVRLRDGARSTQQSIVKADMHNESDALAILALASREVEHDREREPNEEDAGAARGSMDTAATSGDTSGTTRNVRLPSTPSVRHGATSQRKSYEEPFPHQRELVAGRGSNGGEVDEDTEDISLLNRFDLVERGIMMPTDVVKLCEIFFRRHHHIFPMVATSVIPRNPHQIARFATNERYLVTSMIIIASRHDQSPRMRDIHDRSWAVMREYMNDVFYLGLQPTVGLVEGLLLLAENLPRNPDLVSKLERVAGETKEGVHGAENRQAWMLTGMAIRTAYGLGIDQVSTTVPAEDEGSEVSPELERARLAWTYCFLFDRHISLRLGKAFWSRGPNLCFRGYSDLNQTGPAAAKVNFPTLIVGCESRRSSGSTEHPPLAEGADELGCLVQAYVELTQLMSNAHDVLYPSRMRTHSLVKYGEYFKYMDDFNLSLETFQTVWKNKRWHTFPLTDIVWCMFYYVRLYISAFSFQAHVERASERAEQEAASRRRHEDTDPDQAWRPPESLFPRGGAASPDARYIYESIRAATEILIICVESLHPGGALPYLPSRFTLLFQYGAVFLLKAVYSGAMVRSDIVKTLQLIDRLCFCLASSSQDKEHPAVRYAAMLRLLSKKLAVASSTSGNPTSPSSPKETGREDGPSKSFSSAAGGEAATSSSNVNTPSVPAAFTTSQGIIQGSQGGSVPPPQEYVNGRRRSTFFDFPGWRPPFGVGVDHMGGGGGVHQQGMIFDGAGSNSNGNVGADVGVWNTHLEGQQQSMMMDQQQMNNYAPPPMMMPMNVGNGFLPAPPRTLDSFAPQQQQQQQQQEQQQQQQQQSIGGGTGSNQSQGGVGYMNQLSDIYQEMDALFEPLQAEEGMLFDFDLQDFWSKVGPGEAQGGFPFR